jgi:hypothetical protein
VLAAVEQLLVQLDLERAEATSEPWLSRRLPLMPSSHPLNITNALAQLGLKDGGPQVAEPAAKSPDDCHHPDAERHRTVCRPSHRSS